MCAQEPHVLEGSFFVVDVDSVECSKDLATLVFDNASECRKLAIKLVAKPLAQCDVELRAVLILPPRVCDMPSVPTTS